MTRFIIDVQHHVMGGNPRRHAIDRPAWSMEIDEAAMDRLGVAGVLLSLPVASTPKQTREINDFLAGFVAYDARRYGMLACLPSAYSDAALSEIDYALGKLGADGFIMPTNVNGLYIGDDRMDAILAELDRRSAVVFVHPVTPGAVPSLFVSDMSVCEYPLDTTRAVMDLVYRGKIRKYPGIKWVLAHAGGAIPFLAYRLSTVAEEVKASALSEKDVLTDLKSLYYDVALSTAPCVFAALKDMVGASHMMFGSDYPLRFEGPVAASIETILTYPGFDAEELDWVMSGTARSLFPRFQ